MDIQALRCPQCASTNINRAPDGTLHCRDCRTRLIMVDQLGHLVRPTADGWLDCHRCGAVNQADNYFCTQCGTEIRYKCPNCGDIRLGTEPICGNCGQSHQGASLLAAAKQLRKRRRNRSLVSAGVAGLVITAIWFVVVGALDWENDSTIDAIATVLCCLIPLGPLAVGAIAYWWQRNLGNDPTAGHL